MDGLAATTEQNVLCWIKADRKTMKRNMLDCKLTIPDQMGYEIGDGESMLGNSVTMTSVGGKTLKSHEVCIFSVCISAHIKYTTMVTIMRYYHIHVKWIIISPKFENFADIMFLVAPPSPPSPPPHANACTGHNFVTNTPIKFIAIEVPDYKNPMIFGINRKAKWPLAILYKQCSKSLHL